MKRVKAACICQTLHFLLKEELPHDMAVRLVRQEVDSYKAGLERNHTAYKIVEQTELEDASVQMKILKQYNQTPVGSYLD